MSARMGLKTRLTLARTLVFTGLQADPKTLADVVRRCCRQRADLIAISQPDAIADDLVLGYRASFQAMDDHPAVLGVYADARLALKTAADLVISAEGVRPVRGHRYSLAVVLADSPASMSEAFADPQVDAVLLPPGQVVEAARLLPPAQPSSKPWFVVVDSIESARSAVRDGARRLAFESPDGEGLSGYRELLDDLWLEEMRQVRFTSNNPQWG